MKDHLLGRFSPPRTAEIYCLRRPEARWMAVRQHDRYAEIVAGVFDSVALTPAHANAVARQIVARIDGIILQYLVYQDKDRSKEDIRNIAHGMGELIPDALVSEIQDNS